MTLKDIGNPNQEMKETTVERPGTVDIKMPWELYKMLNWGTGDGIEWTYIDPERVLIQRVKAEDDSAPIPQHEFEEKPFEIPTTETKDSGITKEDLENDQGKTFAQRQEEYKEQIEKSKQKEVYRGSEEQIDEWIKSEEELRQKATLWDVPDMTEKELFDHKKKMIEKYSDVEVTDYNHPEEGVDAPALKGVKRYEPVDGIKRGTPEWDAEIARLKELGPPPSIADDGHHTTESGKLLDDLEPDASTSTVEIDPTEDK